MIESSADFPSVALAKRNGDILWYKIMEEKQSHSEKLPLLLEEAMAWTKQNNFDLFAVAVNAGPGSYTGLRIGLSLAKGICYSMGIKLLAIDGLRAMGLFALQKNKNVEFCFSMLDARRDEVFLQKVFSESNDQKTESVILSTEFLLGDVKPFMIAGNANEKFIKLTGIKQVDDCFGPTAEQLCYLIPAAIENQDFKNVAYYEPFYLKDFIPGTPKKFAI